MNTEGYGALVFDLASDINSLLNQDLSSFEIQFNSMKLVTGTLPKDTTTTTITTNVIKKVREVTEGWSGSYSSTNAGFGIIIALVIAVFVAFAILFVITYKRLRKQKERVVRLGKDIGEADTLIFNARKRLEGDE